MGSPAASKSSGSAQLLILFLVVGLHLCGAQSPAPAPSTGTPPTPVAYVSPTAPVADALPSPSAQVADAAGATLGAPIISAEKHMKATFIGGSIGGVVALVVVVWFILSCFKWRKNTTNHDFVTRTGGPRELEYSDLAVATDNFSRERVIGRGAFGVVYRGTLISKGSSSSSGVHSKESSASSTKESGVSSNPSSKESDSGEVAVKKILNGPEGGNLDFFAEMSTISAAKHKNLVKLKGWCCRKNNQNMLDFMCWCCRNNKDEELFLVYELVPNGNLHYHLRESEQVIAWPTRY